VKEEGKGVPAGRGKGGGEKASKGQRLRENGRGTGCDHLRAGKGVLFDLPENRDRSGRTKGPSERLFLRGQSGTENCVGGYAKLLRAEGTSC